MVRFEIAYAQRGKSNPRLLYRLVSDVYCHVAVAFILLKNNSEHIIHSAHSQKKNTDEHRAAAKDDTWYEP